MRAPALRISSVRTRLTLWNVLTMALLLIALGAMLHYLALVRLEAAVDDQLVDIVQRRVGMPPPMLMGMAFGTNGRRHGWLLTGPGGLGGGFGGPGGPNVVMGFGGGPGGPGGPSTAVGLRGFGGSAGFVDPGGPSGVVSFSGPGGPGPVGPDGQPRPHPSDPPGTIAEARQQRDVQRGSGSDDGDAAAPILLMPRYLTPDGQTPPPPGGHVFPPWDPATFALSLRGESRFSTIQVDGEPVRIYSAPLRYRESVTGVVQAAATLTETEQEVNRITRDLLTLLPFALVGVAFTGAFLTGRALRPVQEITQAAERIEVRSLSGRLTIHGDDEFARLAATFNGMLERLERAFVQQRRFTADASHELRTPLTIIKTNASLALSANRKSADYRRTLAIVDQAADMMTHIVEDLLFLARSEAAVAKVTQVSPEREPVLLDDVLAIAVGTVRNPSQAPISLDTADSSLRVLGDRYDLIRLFTNLLTNAVRHTPEGCVRVFAFVAEDDEVVVEVADTGEGIAPEHLPHVFEAFYRADASRTRAQGGTGLGLPICRAIAEAHGGTISLESVVHQGTVVHVRLPRFASDPHTSL